MEFITLFKYEKETSNLNRILYLNLTNQITKQKLLCIIPSNKSKLI